MNRQKLLPGLMIAVSAIALASCKQENHKRSAAPDRSKAPKSFIVRVASEGADERQEASKFKVDLMASSDDLKGSSAAQVERSFNAGQTLNISEQEKGYLATDAAGNAFALNGCQGYNTPLGLYQYPYDPMPAGNVYNQSSVVGGFGSGIVNNGFGGIIRNILGGILGRLIGGRAATPLNFGQILSQAFTGGGFMPIGLPYGQNGFQYGCGYPMPFGQQPYPYAPYPQPLGQPGTQPFAQGFPSGYGPTPYPYMGQYQQGPYTYYTYGQQPGFQPVMQPGFQPTAQPGGQPFSQPAVPQYPQGPQSQYTYTPYPTQYSNGSTIQ
jgi:hypothetical protein